MAPRRDGRYGFVVLHLWHSGYMTVLHIAQSGQKKQIDHHTICWPKELKGLEGTWGCMCGRNALGLHVARGFHCCDGVAG